MTFALVCSFAPSASGVDANEARTIFNQRCTACHSFGKGVKVGPDLKGVTERRERPWLLRFVRGSSTMVESDAVAKKLFEDFKGIRMPDWSDLSEDQVNAVLDYLAANGPEHEKEPDERGAELATAIEIDAGSRLFRGAERLRGGGIACSSCHTVRDGRRLVGGSLGPDLTNVYARYKDRALTLFLRQPCFRRAPDATAIRYASPEESFALKAFLRHVALSNGGK